MMDVTEAFSEDLMRLDNICLNAVAARLWDSQFLKKFIVEEINQQNKNNEKHPFSVNITDSNANIIDKLHQLPLPHQLLLQLEEIVLHKRSLLKRYLFVVINELNLDISDVDEVYWTWYGTVDLEKIYYSYWKKKSDFMDLSICIIENGIPMVYLMAAIFVDEQFIKENQDGIIKSIWNEQLVSKIEENNKDTWYIISVVICLCQFQLTRKPPLEISPFSMFELCYKESFYAKTTQYFWKKMSDRDRSTALNKLINIRNVSDILITTPETLYFLINQMSRDEKNIFLKNKSIFIMLYFRFQWPYLKLIFMIYDTDFLTPENYFWHIRFCLSAIKYLTMPDDTAMHLSNSKIFCKLWSKLSKEYKLQLPESSINLLNFRHFAERDSDNREGALGAFGNFGWCTTLMQNYSYYPCLKRILSDTDLQTRRDEIINVILDILLGWIENYDDGPEKVQKFFVEVFTTEDERKILENKLDVAITRKHGLKFLAD